MLDPPVDPVGTGEWERSQTDVKGQTGETEGQPSKEGLGECQSDCVWDT